MPVLKIAGKHDRFVSITDNDLRIISLIAQGKTNQQIADDIGRSVQTIKNQVGTLLSKTQLPNRVALCVTAIKNAWIAIS